MQVFLTGSFFLYVVSLATSMSGMELFSSLLILGLLITFAIQGRWPGLPSYWRPMALFICIAVIGVLIDDAPFREKLYNIQRMRFFFIYAFVFFYFRDSVKDTRWINVLLVTTFVVGIYGFVQHFIAIDLIRPEGKKVLLYAVQEEKIGPLVVGTFNHHLTFSNVYSFYACLFTSVGLFFFPKRAWILLMGAFIYVLVFWTESRAAWVMIPVTLVLIAGFKSRKAVLIAVCIALGMGLFFLKVDPGFRERLGRTFVKKDGLYHLGARARLWEAQIEMFKEHPFFGMGFNNNERRSKEYVDKLFPDTQNNFYGHAHSEFLQILASMGIFGMIAFLWLWFEVFRDCIYCVKHWTRDTLEFWLSLGCFAAFVGFHIQGVTQWNFGDAEVLHNVLFFWAVIATLKLKAVSKA
jgi:putative inorganic carbon (hco3(-)) transporter